MQLQSRPAPESKCNASALASLARRLKQRPASPSCRFERASTEGLDGGASVRGSAASQRGSRQYQASAGRPSFGGRRTARGLPSKGERYEHVSRSCPKRSWSSRAAWPRSHNPPRGHRIGRKARPNPSLEATVTGKALGPRARGSYHRPRGPSAFPAPAPQLKR